MQTFLCWFISLITALTGAAAFASNALRAGPMVGDADMHNVSIWMQTEQPGEITVSWWPQQRPQERRSMTLPTRDQGIATAIARLRDLQSGQTYAYQVRVDGQDSGVFNFRTQSDWRSGRPAVPPSWRLALGSCAYIRESGSARDGQPPAKGYDIFERMADQAPDLTLWLGDNLYFRSSDFTSPEGMAYRYRHDRALPQLQRLLRTGRHHAIWDDHDYGPNDSNRSFVFKDAALELFRHYWPNRSLGLPQHPGIFGNFTEGDVEFFLLDGRTYRDSDRDDSLPVKELFGAEQMRWLRNALASSTATFKMIAGGSQFLNDHNRFEGWTHFRSERGQFLDWLAARRITGVIFLSGDRHHTELIRHAREGGYPLFELTCSALATRVPRVLPGEDGKPGLVPGTLVQQNNFCTIDFSGPHDDRRMVLRSFLADGREAWSHAIRASELR